MNGHEPHDRVLALVAGKSITFHDVEVRLAAIKRGSLAPRLPSSGPEDRRGSRWVLRLLVTEAIVSHHAGIARFQAAPVGAAASFNGLDVGDAGDLAAAAERIFDQVTSGVRVSEGEVLDYYLRNLDLYHCPERRLIRHGLAGDRMTAELMAAAWALPDARAPTFELRRGEMAGVLEDAVFGARVGDLIGPLQSDLGWHVAIVDTVFEAGHHPFDQVRPAIEADLLSHARGREFDLWLERERRALATLEPDWAHPGDPSSPVFNHRH